MLIGPVAVAVLVQADLQVRGSNTGVSSAIDFAIGLDSSRVKACVLLDFFLFHLLLDQLFFAHLFLRTPPSRLDVNNETIYGISDCRGHVDGPDEILVSHVFHDHVSMDNDIPQDLDVICNLPCNFPYKLLKYPSDESSDFADPFRALEYPSLALLPTLAYLVVYPMFRLADPETEIQTPHLQVQGPEPQVPIPNQRAKDPAALAHPCQSLAHPSRPQDAADNAVDYAEDEVEDSDLVEKGDEDLSDETGGEVRGKGDVGIHG